MNLLRLRDPSFSDPFENAFRRFFSPVLADADTQPLTMRLDVSETDGAYRVKADLPGVKKEDINVRVDGNVVQIDAQSQSERETKGEGERVLRTERSYGTISRTFSLASDIDESKVQAKYADGVLTLQLPKKAAATGAKIAIQ
ncbi:MAG: Hsp20/alpha crystallin family protein [Ramlibacter sp.]